MNKRIYNIIFHLHTVSGIVISAALFVIFFTGSFSFFRDEIVNWERNHTVNYTENIEMDYDALFDSLSANYNLTGRDIALQKYYVERRVGINLGGSKDSLATEEDKTSHFFYADIETYETSDYTSSYSLGEFLYRLHFLAQIPYPYGYYLSGFIAFFFLFALLTGIIIHWDKIISNFYVFRPWSKLKTLWTDAHTALGTIGFPFQFVYAVTGAFFMIKGILIAPSIMILYDGNQGRFYNDLGYGEPSFTYESKALQPDININQLVSETSADWPEFNINHLHIFNYGDANMHVSIEGEMQKETKFTGPAKRIYKIATQDIVDEKEPYNKASYLDGVKNALYRLHLGDYGGYALRIVSFLLGMISCFVILSGVMIWQVARDKKNIPESRKRFNNWVAQIYLAICMTMFPVTAAAFIMVKMVNAAGMGTIYNFYFLSWLALTIFFVWRRSLAVTTKYNLLLGGLIGILVPITNGIMTGEWIWKSLASGHYQIFFIDVFWTVLSAITLIYTLTSGILKQTALKLGGAKTVRVP